MFRLSKFVSQSDENVAERIFNRSIYDRLIKNLDDESINIINSIGNNPKTFYQSEIVFRFLSINGIHIQKNDQKHDDILKEISHYISNEFDDFTNIQLKRLIYILCIVILECKEEFG